MLLRQLSKSRRIISGSTPNILFYQSKLNQSNDSVANNANKDNMENILFGSNTINDTLGAAVESELSRSDFGFYQKLLPIDTVQAMISNINFLFGILSIFYFNDSHASE